MLWKRHRKHHLLAVLTCLMALWAPLAEADISMSQENEMWKSGLALYNQGDFFGAKSKLLKLVRVRPSNSLYWFNLGNSYFMLKDFSRAQIAFSKVENLKGPLAPAAMLYRAKAIKANGDPQAARSLLQILIVRKDLTPAIREEATRDLVASSEETDEALSLYKAGKYARALRVINKNKPLNEDQQLLKALILIKLDREDHAHAILKKLEDSEPLRGLVTTILDRIRDNYSKPHWLFVEAAGGFDSGSLLFADAGGGVRWWEDNLWYANTGYTLRVRETPDHPEEKTLSQEVRLNAGRELGTELFLVSPYYARDSADIGEIRSTLGVNVRGRWGSPKLEWGADGEWVKDESLNETYSYLDGSRQRYSLSVGRIDNSVYMRAQLNYSKNKTGEAHDEWGPSLRVLWRLQATLVAESSVSYSNRKYELLGRKDLHALSARITKIFSPRLAAYLSWTQYNENTNRTQVLAGVIWDVL